MRRIGRRLRGSRKVWSPKNLGRPLEKVVAKGGSAGVDKQSARQIEVHKDQTIAKLEQELRTSQYQPQAVVDADLKSYFDTIPQNRLMDRIREKMADGRVLKLVEQMLQAGVMDSAKGWQPTEQGTPQGAVVSPLLSNIYLNGLDWQMARNGFEMVRYADDFIVLCDRPRPKSERNMATRSK